MNFNELVKSKIDRLITIRLTDGVQPEDLASNIYLNDYKKINFYKSEGNIIGELTFEEEIHGKIVDTTLRYFYSESKRLLRIEEIISNRLRIEWDRDIVEEGLVNDIIDILKNKCSDEEIKRFIKTLPDDLKSKIESACSYVA